MDKLWRYAGPLQTLLDRRERIHFLHIGKNAGTQIKHIASQVNEGSDAVRIVLHGHKTGLRHLEFGARYFFSIRRPEERFVSAFYSRKRKGMPRVYVEWSRHERVAFERFEHANDLAEALFDDTAKGAQALCAMKSIKHCSMDQIDWFDRTGYFLEIHPPVGIVRQAAFDRDIRRVFQVLGIESYLDRVTDDPVSAHRNDYSEVPPLSEKAVSNLLAWYRQDVEFYRVCEQWIVSRS